MPGSGNRSATHPKPKGKTFAPRSHEVTEKAKDRWVCFGPQGFRSLEPGFRYLGTLSPSGRRGNRIKARILPVTREVWVFPWPHFSDTGTISKYRYSALDGTAGDPAGRRGTHLFFAVLRVSVTPWCKGFAFGCGFVAVCFKLLAFQNIQCRKIQVNS